MWKVVLSLLLFGTMVAGMYFINESNKLNSLDSDEDILIGNISMPNYRMAALFDDGLPRNDNVCYYLVKNTIVNHTKDKEHRQFSVDVKILNGMVLSRDNYSFRESDGVIYYKTSNETEAVVREGSLLDKIWKYGLNYLGID